MPLGPSPGDGPGSSFRTPRERAGAAVFARKARELIRQVTTLARPDGKGSSGTSCRLEASLAPADESGDEVPMAWAFSRVLLAQGSAGGAPLNIGGSRLVVSQILDRE